MSEAYRQLSGNPLLVRDGIGKGKPATHMLPPEGHAYGVVVPPDPEGVREVVQNWASHVPARRPGPEPQDFLRLNKWAAKNGVSSAGKLKEWRVDHSVKLLRSGSTGAFPMVVPSDVFPSFAYGRRSRPSTPIGPLVGGVYAAEQEEFLDAGYQKLAAERERGTSSSGRRIVRMTKAAKQQISSGREQRATLEGSGMPKPVPFKMEKFKKVQSRLGLNLPEVPLRSGVHAPQIMSLNLPPLPRAASTPCL